MSPGDRPPTVWDRLPKGGGAAYDLAANVLVGAGLGWLVQRFFPGANPWGYVGGTVLGAVSGFYRLFREQARLDRERAQGKDHRP